MAAIQQDHKVKESILKAENKLRFFDNLTLEKFDNLIFEEAVFRMRMIEETKLEDYKNNMITASFQVWQANPNKKTFSEYLKMLGLHERDKKLTKEQRDKLIDKGLAIAEKIIKADQKR